MTKAYGVAIVIAGDSTYPQIADLTGPFIYARIMGTLEAEPLGYAKSDLDLWAHRAKSWASGKEIKGLNVVTTPSALAQPRDVYLYVIGGHKVTNPAAAMALVKRVS